ncbi:MAG: gliding motility protein, partial [Deltaproteobacteria bacterium]|nr:gliding motility protein [Deltaproteobacteria bacterium]
MQLDLLRREITIKLVYYGPPFSGKTTNLQALESLVAPEIRGPLLSVDTKGDRTILFDLLPVQIEAGRGVQIRLKLYTVPGQVIHRATRALILQGADGVAFIADSQRTQLQANRASFLDLRANLKERGVDPASIPMVIQFNKRDLPNIISDEEIDALALKSPEPIHKAIAAQGEGVRETLYTLFELTWKKLNMQHQIEERLEIEQNQVLSSIAK